MEPEKNIQLTVIQPQDQEDEISIDLYEIWHGVKRFFALWLALAIAVGAIAAGIGIGTRKLVHAADASALLEYDLDEDSAVDISRLQMPSLIEEAMNSVGISVDQLNDVRNGISITALMSEDAYDQQTLYYNMLAKNGTNIEIVRSLLNTNETSNRYIVSLDYQEAKLTREEGIALLDAIIAAYQRYFNSTYNDNAMLGSSLQVIDYKDYDYAEALNVFRQTMNEIQEYLEQAMEGDMNTFRSNATGYTLADLLQIEQMLRQTELSRISSFIEANGVTSKDIKTEIAHYEWLIQEEKRARSVQESKLTSLEQTIGGYTREPLVYTTDETGMLVKSSQDEADAYDVMILQKLEVQEAISESNTTIRYYESVIEKLSQRESVVQENINTADEYLTSFNAKLNHLIEDVNETVTEYYEKAVRENALRIVVPATAETQGIMQGKWIKYMMILEVVLLLGYLGTGFMYGMIKANPRKKPEAA